MIGGKSGETERRKPRGRERHRERRWSNPSGGPIFKPTGSGAREPVFTRETQKLRNPRGRTGELRRLFLHGSSMDNAFDAGEAETGPSAVRPGFRQLVGCLVDDLSVGDLDKFLDG
jgi:hypothetical protein